MNLTTEQALKSISAHKEENLKTPNAFIGYLTPTCHPDANHNLGILA